jgi:hypothetical protein
MTTSPPPSSSTVKPWPTSQVRSAMSWVPPVCGLASFCPRSCCGSVMSRGRPAPRRRGGAGDDPQRLALALTKPLIAGLGPR